MPARPSTPPHEGSRSPWSRPVTWPPAPRRGRASSSTVACATWSSSTSAWSTRRCASVGCSPPGSRRTWSGRCPSCCRCRRSVWPGRAAARLLRRRGRGLRRVRRPVRPGARDAAAPPPLRGAGPADLPVPARGHGRRRDPLLRRPGRRRAAGRHARPYGGQPRRRRRRRRPRSPGSARSAREVTGVRGRDVESGESFDVAARTVIAATGVWSDDVAEMIAAGGGPFRPGLRVRASKGVHIVVPRAAISGDAGLILRTGEVGPVRHPLGRALDHRHHRHRLAARPGPPGRLGAGHRVPARPGQPGARPTTVHIGHRGRVRRPASAARRRGRVDLGAVPRARGGRADARPHARGRRQAHHLPGDGGRRGRPGGAPARRRPAPVPHRRAAAARRGRLPADVARPGGSGPPARDRGRGGRAPAGAVRDA